MSGGEGVCFGRVDGWQEALRELLEVRPGSGVGARGQHTHTTSERRTSSISNCAASPDLVDLAPMRPGRQVSYAHIRFCGILRCFDLTRRHSPDRIEGKQGEELATLAPTKEPMSTHGRTSEQPPTSPLVMTSQRGRSDGVKEDRPPFACSSQGRSMSIRKAPP